MGNVFSANLGQAPARQAALAADLPSSCISTTINKVCASGLKAITLAAQAIALGQERVVVAGGMENMSQIPHYALLRFGSRLSNLQLVDGLLHDGLLDPHLRQSMGLCAEACARKHSFSRAQQDGHARESYRRAKAAWVARKFAPEIASVPGVEAYDEELKQIDVGILSEMRPAFGKGKDATVTKGNSSGLSDGGAALVLMSAERAAETAAPVMATVLGYADVEQNPLEFTTSPSVAIPKALARAGISIHDVDVFEINEAFSVVSLANAKLLELDDSKVNVFGGAVSLGHPLGCSGARILVTLLNVLNDRKGRYGVAAICNGGGGATAIVVERSLPAEASL